jgi:integrase
VTVYRPKDRNAWEFDFYYKGERHRGSTGQLNRDDAERFELREKERIRRRAAGLADLRDAPAFADWAGVYYTYKATSTRAVKRPDAIDFTLRSTLKFWGRKPTDPAKVDADAPYHDLTLADPIQKATWLQEFEIWMTQQGYSGSHKNHLRTQVSGMYKVAALPQFRDRTGIQPSMNPMQGVPRDRQVRRHVTLTPGQVRAWISAASYHVRLALAIAVLAPKLRLGNILALRWDRHLDPKLTRIEIAEHKTAHETGLPLVVHISQQLRAILKAARKRGRSHFVVSYHGHGLTDIGDGVKGAAERAGIPYGRGDAGGATFHTMRHAVATWLAGMGDLTEAMRASLLAHSDIATTQIYTHMQPLAERQPLERLGRRVKLADVVNAAGSRPRERRGDSAKKPAKSARSKGQTRQAKTARAEGKAKTRRTARGLRS